MRFSSTLIALAGLATAASAAHIKLVARQYPTCADPCIENADLDGCFSDDNSCLCHSAVFVNNVTACINTACSGADIATADDVADEICADVGVNLSTIVSSASPTSSGSSTPSTTSATHSASATAPSSSGSSSGSPSSGSSSPSTSSNTVSPSSTSLAPAPSQTGNGALSHGVNAFAGLAALGVAALAL